MRTLASTFSTREEAEAARRRLESAGVARERITLKDVAQAAEGPAAAGSAGIGSTAGAFISVKVTTDQVEGVSEILKARWRAEPAAAAPDIEGRPLGSSHDAAAELNIPPRPLPARDAGLGPVSPGQEAEPQHRPGGAQRAAQDRSRLSRYVIFYLLAVVGAFMIGAWLGLAS